MCGPPAVGKSTVGFEIFLSLSRDGIRAAYVDLAQISFCRPVPDLHRLRADNLARMRDAYHAAGAECLVVSGNVTDPGDLARYQSAQRIPHLADLRCRQLAHPPHHAVRCFW